MVATNVKGGQELSSGMGVRALSGGRWQAGRGGGAGGGGGAMGGGAGRGQDDRPGGGLGAPVDAPDPVHEYRAFILGAFALVLVMGGS